MIVLRLIGFEVIN